MTWAREVNLVLGLGRANSLWSVQFRGLRFALFS